MSDHLPDAGKMVDLDRLQALHEAATPGPWNARQAFGPGNWAIWASSGDDCEERQAASATPSVAQLTAAMRNALPALLAEVRALRQMVETQRGNISIVLDENAQLRGKLDEREGDMHLRIRAGYDKTVADSWRREVARVEKERDELRADREKTEAALRGFCDKVAEPKFNRYGLVVEQQKDGTYSRVRDIVRTDMGNLWREPKETTNG